MSVSVHASIRIYLEYSVSTDDGWQCRLQCQTADQHNNSPPPASVWEGERGREREKGSERAAESLTAYQI